MNFVLDDESGVDDGCDVDASSIVDNGIVVDDRFDPGLIPFWPYLLFDIDYECCHCQFCSNWSR